jgi:hypothetical protein
MIIMKTKHVLGSNAYTHETSIFSDVMEQLSYFILYHAYVFSLLAMLTWAFLYHSVFGLFFLAIPCILLAQTDSRKWSFKLSTYLVGFAEFLLFAQYIYSLDLRIDELPNQNWMKIIGFMRAENRTAAFVTLLVKVKTFIGFFWICFCIIQNAHSIGGSSSRASRAQKAAKMCLCA